MKKWLFLHCLLEVLLISYFEYRRRSTYILPKFCCKFNSLAISFQGDACANLNLIEIEF